MPTNDTGGWGQQPGVSQATDAQLRAAIQSEIADAKRRRDANRATISSGYEHLQGALQDPQDHPANNVSHPHGNRGRADATMSTIPGYSQDPPMSSVPGSDEW